jgi:hypothetical protein
MIEKNENLRKQTYKRNYPQYVAEGQNDVHHNI